MICKKVRGGVGCSVVEHDGVRYVFVTAAPTHPGTLAEQADSVLKAIQTHFQAEGVFRSIVMQSVFVKRVEDQAVCRRIVEDFHGQDLPATTYIPQQPCDGSLVSVEAWGVGTIRGELAIERPSNGMVIVRHNGVLWAYVADIGPETATGSVYERSFCAFRSADERLAFAGLRFEDVVRTWLYLGDILGTGGQTDRYSELNRARADHYQNRRFGSGLIPTGWDKPVFPASTAIGVDGRDVAMSCIALRTNRSDVALLPLENPRQTSAYDYAHQHEAERPKFVRAMAVVAGELVTTFVSGTASITASRSRHDDDAEQQTRQSLDNIEALLAVDNFRCHGALGVGATLDDLAVARVYIKRQTDYSAVRTTCQARLGDLPISYVLGDICRPELLVEIEGIAFSRREG